MLYLPPLWGHDGVAEGECMTCSVGFRAPRALDLARQLAQRLGERVDDDGGRLYRDATQPATATPAAVPTALADFALTALRRLLEDRDACDEALGQWLSEPKASVWFDGGAPWPQGMGLALDRRTRMLYDARRLYVNGEAFRIGGRDAALLRRLADEGRLGARDAARLSAGAREVVSEWASAGWLRVLDDGDAGGQR